MILECLDFIVVFAGWGAKVGCICFVGVGDHCPLQIDGIADTEHYTN